MADYDLKVITPDSGFTTGNFLFGADDQSSATPVPYTAAGIKTFMSLSPTLVTPVLGVATATSINGLTITATTGGVLTIPNSVTLTGPAASGTAMTLGNAEAVSGIKTFATGQIVNGTLRLGTVSSVTGQLLLANSASALLTTIQAGNAAAARTYTWPTNFGSAGQQLTDAAGDGTLSWAAAGGSGSPGGSDTQVQFNDGGAFGGDAGLTYDKTTNALTITQGATDAASALTIVGQSALSAASRPVINATQTWNNAATTFVGLALAITDTASAAASNLVDVKLGASSVFQILKAGGARFAGTVSSTSSGTDRVDIGVESGTPRIHFENVGAGIWSIDISNTWFRWFVPGSEQMVLTDTSQLRLKNTGLYSFADGASPSIGSVDTNISRNAAGVIQFGTTAANASGAWLAAKGTITGGTLADQGLALSLSATMPASPTAEQRGVLYSVTGAGSAAQINRAMFVTYLAGYTGALYSIAFSADNANAGTGSVLITAAGAGHGAANYGITGRMSATTTGTNIGFAGTADGGNVNAAVLGVAQVAKNAATNIGVAGSAINTGTTPVHIGGWFSLNQTTTPTVSAALIADNGAQTSPIFLARDAGTTVFTIADGGGVSSAGSITYTTAASGPILKQGANGRCGTFVANGVTPVTVSNTSVAITDTIIISLNTVGGTVGVQPHVDTITAATGFTVVCTAADTSTYNYAIIKNAA